MRICTHTYTYQKGKPVNTLIVSPPGCGKTTLLRDIARILSRRHIKVAICDERSEIAGMYDSKPSFDLGPRTDVLDGCDKVYGIPMLIRSMSPDVIITDEMGKPRDVGAADQCAGAGVSLITSIHGSCEKDIINSSIGSLIHKGAFDNIIHLSAESGPERHQGCGFKGGFPCCKLVGLPGAGDSLRTFRYHESRRAEKKSSFAGGLPADDHRAERTDKLFQGASARYIR